MQRSSGSIASLAAALAKAQTELVNPEKSLVATILKERGGISEQFFRYAPLSSGLEIVRKTLGQHDIATLQTTSIDQAAGTVNLTTMLAHSSGEWIASDWPVCPVADTATPRRMGAALTYARRYALFTLVGIAGEDDLDAPDLMAPTGQTSSTRETTIKAKPNGRLNNRGQPASGRRFPVRQNGKEPLALRQPVFATEASAKLRDRLIAELNAVTSDEDAALWALKSLPEKNKLVTADAQKVEQCFQAKLTHPGTRAGDSSGTNGVLEPPLRARRGTIRDHKGPRSKSIDKSALALSEPRRIRDREHVRYVAKQPCLICGRNPSDAHHLRFAQSSALGRKVSDEFTVPLCRGHHRELHRCGDEGAWWRKVGIDPALTAHALWIETHPL